jgi:hypothetical protein
MKITPTTKVTIELEQEEVIGLVEALSTAMGLSNYTGANELLVALEGVLVPGRKYFENS